MHRRDKEILGFYEVPSQVTCSMELGAGDMGTAWGDCSCPHAVWQMQWEADGLSDLGPRLPSPFASADWIFAHSGSLRSVCGSAWPWTNHFTSLCLSYPCLAEGERLPYPMQGKVL